MLRVKSDRTAPQLPLIHVYDVGVYMRQNVDVTIRVLPTCEKIASPHTLQARGKRRKMCPSCMRQQTSKMDSLYHRRYLFALLVPAMPPAAEVHSRSECRAAQRILQLNDYRIGDAIS
jgi:hypothetical protein